jgi:hypothetical protein
MSVPGACRKAIVDMIGQLHLLDRTEIELPRADLSLLLAKEINPGVQNNPQALWHSDCRIRPATRQTRRHAIGAAVFRAS